MWVESAVSLVCNGCSLHRYPHFSTLIPFYALAETTYVNAGEENAATPQSPKAGLSLYLSNDFHVYCSLKVLPEIRILFLTA